MEKIKKYSRPENRGFRIKDLIIGLLIILIFGFQVILILQSSGFIAY
jgi:hypothetical protein